MQKEDYFLPKWKGDTQSNTTTITASVKKDECEGNDTENHLSFTSDEYTQFTI